LHGDHPVPARGSAISRWSEHGRQTGLEGGAGIDTTRKPLADPDREPAASTRPGFLHRPAWWAARIGPLHSDDPRLRVLLAHLAALAAALGVTVLQRTPAATSSRMVVAFAIVLGVSALRTATVQRPLALTTICLDAVGTVLLVAGTGAPGSPFGWFALAGVWWAAHLRRPRSGLIYAIVFTAAYAVLVVPEAIRQQELASSFERIGALMVVAFLADWFVRVDRRALALNEALQVPRFGPEHIAIREGLERALGNLDIPLDVVLAAGQLGLTAIQAELLSYLVLGLTNLEIADAMHLSEAAVRYRLTRLYRTLGVTGRGEAADRARELGLDGPVEPISAASQT
jgi:DNA-binding CsgD family transcriptional regulator